VNGDREKQPIAVPLSDSTSAQKQYREKYAVRLEQEEIAQGLANNPSVDAETQRAIVREYRALHQQIKDEGLYKCHYINYKKDCIRYGILFAAFMYLLHIKWCLTSSIFLGLFWVC
jgi:delta8-fatty-acid desaturase